MNSENVENALALEAQLLEQRTLDARRVQTFWSWWEQKRAVFEQSIERGFSQAESDALTQQVHVLHEGLVWSMGRSLSGEYEFMVSAEGNLELRALVEQWRSDAPEGLQNWSMLTACPPQPIQGNALSMGGVSIDFDGFEFAVERDMRLERLHLLAYHPAIGKLDSEQAQVALYVFLSNLLGEDALERWIGDCDCSSTPSRPDGSAQDRVMYGLSGDQLRMAVAKFADEARGYYELSLRADTPEGPVQARVNAALKRMNYPSLIWHVEIRTRLQGPVVQGLPGSQEEAELERMGATLLERLGTRAVFVGHETGQGHRRIHLYVSKIKGVHEEIQQWAERFDGRGVDWIYTYEPIWEIQEQLF